MMMGWHVFERFKECTQCMQAFRLGYSFDLFQTNLFL